MTTATVPRRASAAGGEGAARPRGDRGRRTRARGEARHGLRLGARPRRPARRRPDGDLPPLPQQGRPHAALLDEVIGMASSAVDADARRLAGAAPPARRVTTLDGSALPGDRRRGDRAHDRRSRRARRHRAHARRVLTRRPRGRRPRAPLRTARVARARRARGHRPRPHRARRAAPSADRGSTGRCSWTPASTRSSPRTARRLAELQDSDLFLVGVELIIESAERTAARAG